MTLEDILDVEFEIVLFSKKLAAAKKRVVEDGRVLYGSKETGAVKRAAMDLKNELTKITQ